MVGSGDDHGSDLVLGKAVLAGESGAAITLHEAGSSVAVGIDSGLDTDVASALLRWVVSCQRNILVVQKEKAGSSPA